ncbi:MAG: 1-deoxy-D-xylulose-5-phosphate synthase [Chloroflexi bacterium]|nr:1-deoxy-D-xylulose-5-phosphate synthase [Chloroflexota bacterium]
MPELLERIDGPSTLKRLSLSELESLAEEIRNELISTVTNTGGHLASNLGVVELTIALHRVFDSPNDKLIWDVGHQSYVHKMLTGRRELFASLRQHGGISGFTDKAESPHDHFTSGHASTSISNALGMAVARDMAGDDFDVVAIIGDGSLTGGMAFEAINQAGHLGKKLIVILNDNGMAISPSVGAMARWSNRLRLSSPYQKAKMGAASVVNRAPFGQWLHATGRVLKRKFKGLVLPTMFWEDLGFSYVGPINGHSIAELIQVLEGVKTNYHRPTLVHVYTTKGKGYPPAEEDCISFHGIPPNGTGNGKGPSYSAIFATSLLRLMGDNKRIVAITAAMKEGTGLSVVAEKYPDRFFDVGICEQHAVSFAAGLAARGLIPVVAIYSTFLQRAFDQIIHDVCLQELPVVFAIDRAGIVGEDGKTHQGCFDLSYLAMIPGLVVAAPSDHYQLQHLLYTAVNLNRPMAIRYPRGNTSGPLESVDFETIKIGTGEIVTRGKDLAIVAIGRMVATARSVAASLGDLGIETTVVDARFMKPLDSRLISSVAAVNKRMVTLEESAAIGGFGSSVNGVVGDLGWHDVRVKTIGLPDVFIEHGSQKVLRHKYLMDVEGVRSQVLAAFPELVREPKSIRVR